MNEQKYFVFAFHNQRGGGHWYGLAASESEALARLKRFLNIKRPFRKYTIELEQVLPA